MERSSVVRADRVVRPESRLVLAHRRKLCRPQWALAGPARCESLDVNMPLGHANEDAVHVNDVGRKWDPQGSKAREHSSAQTPMQDLPYDDVAVPSIGILPGGSGTWSRDRQRARYA